MTAPTLARLDRVELAKTGTWSLVVGGEMQFTREDFAAAITALDCPAIGRPIIKLGHLDSRGEGRLIRAGENLDGEPALGYVANLGLANGGNTLRGDMVGMPEWLGQIAASAYPNRSIEGERAFRCAIGHRHPFVVTAVSLLGVTPPAVGTLTSLQDHVRALYGVAAATDPDTPAGEPFTVIFTREDPVPEPFAAAVSVDDIRDAFYDGAPPNLWIVDVQISPPQLIVTSGGDTDAMYRIPYVLAGDDDDEAVTFGTPVPVEVVYQDTAPDPREIGPVGVAAAAGGPPKRRAVFARPGSAQPVAAAERDEVPSQNPDSGPKPAVIPQTDPLQDPVAPPSPAQPVPQQPGAPAPVEPAAEPETTPEPEKGDDVSLSEFRSRLGLPDDADEAAVLVALDERLKTPDPQPDPQPVAAAAAKREQEFAAALGQIQTLSTELAAVKAEKSAERKAAFFAAAIAQGKLKPADRESWEARYDKAPELVTEIVGAIAAGTAVPVAAKGYVGDPEPGVDESDLLALMPPEWRDEKAGDDAKAGVR